MLWFLNIAAKRGYRVDSYRDDAVGTMEKNAGGKLAITTVTLHPHTAFIGETVPTPEAVVAMHKEAHDECFIASSVKTRLTTVPTFEITS
jgi:organic hydroperoxide reductase OsmC/OhrA